VPEVPPNTVRSVPATSAKNPDNSRNFSVLASGFRALLAGLRHSVGAAANGPIEGSRGRVGLGDLDPPAGALSGRRAAGGPPELLGDVLDPLCRSLAAAVGPSLLASASASPAASSGSLVGVSSVTELAAVEEAVRRVAWGGDRRAGIARIELGGAHLGTAITVRGAGRAVTLSIELGGGSDAGSLPARLVERLRARGLDVTNVEVR